MSEDYQVYLPFLRQAIRNDDVALAFAKASARHRLLENDFNNQLLEVCPRPAALAFPHMELDPATYWQRSFFSILFLSIFDAIGIEESRQLRYGKILHGVRGVVTATDNILDDESKGSVRLMLQGGKVLPNVLVMLMESGVIRDAVEEVAADGEAVRRTWRELVAALFALGSEESAEEGAIEQVLSPRDLMDQIHRFRGGGLLQLAFVAPEANEPQRIDAVKAARSAVNHIGLCLQILDDVTDFQEDLTARNHNMLRSYIVHLQPDGPCTDADLSKLSDAEQAAPETKFPRATSEVLQVAVEMGLGGFEILHGLGHPIDRPTALRLMAAMFGLRGLNRLWDIYEAAALRVRQGESPKIDYKDYLPT